MEFRGLVFCFYRLVIFKGFFVLFFWGMVGIVVEFVVVWCLWSEVFNEDGES